MTSFAWKRMGGLALCAALAGTAACGDGGDSGPFLIESRFPASQVTDANLAQDGRAFTNADEDVNGMRVFWNVDGTAIVIALTESDSSGANLLFASFFNGDELSPPVQIRGSHDDANYTFRFIRVLFLNERSRKGDAIITFVREDEDDSTSVDKNDRDANRRLWGTYFDRSLLSKALSGTVRYGFEPTATAIDFDHVRDEIPPVVMGNPPTPVPDANVTGVALVSDSLHGTHDFSGSSASVLSGDPTTQVHILFAKNQSTGLGVQGVKWQSVTFDLAQVGNAIPQQANATAGTLASAGGAYDDSDDAGMVGDQVDSVNVNPAFVHDTIFFWEMEDLGTDDEDYVATASAFTATGTATPILIGSDLTTDPDSTALLAARHLYGPDNGLDAYYVLSAESAFSTGLNGSRASDVDLMVTQIDEGGTTRQVREIDAFTAPINTADGDTDGYTVNAGLDDVDTDAVRSALSEDGSYIGVLFTQGNRTTSDLSDGDMMTINGPTNLVPYAQIIQTRRNNEGRALADSVLTAPVKVPALESTGDLLPVPVPLPKQADITNLQFQIELGSSAGDAGAYQSNVNRMFFSYVQRADQVGGGRVPFQNVLYVNSLEVTPGGVGAAPSLSLGQTSASSARVALPNSAPGQDSGHGVSFNTVVVDRADAVNGYLAVFVANANNTADSTVMGSFAEPRLYAFDGTSTVQISSAGVALDRIVSGSATVRTVGTRNGTRIHMFWHEQVDQNGTATELAARSFEKGTARFAPLAADAPIFLDLITENEIEDGPRVFVDGTTVGVYFVEGGHFYYEETTGDATRFHTKSGDRDPMLIDNESLEVLSDWDIFAPPLEDNLTSGMIYFSKEDIQGNERAYFRIHN